MINFSFNTPQYIINIILILFRLGNAAKVIGYTANGEASDWMLAEKGIISLSPELGNDNKISSEKFYPEKNEIFPILE